METNTGFYIEHCSVRSFGAPQWQVVSDRRGTYFCIFICFAFVLQKGCIYTAGTYHQYLTSPLGGRTAWSSVVMVQGIQYSARFWYEGSHLEQAHEDAAEVALRNITGVTSNGQQPPPARSATFFEAIDVAYFLLATMPGLSKHYDIRTLWNCRDMGGILCSVLGTWEGCWNLKLRK